MIRDDRMTANEFDKILKYVENCLKTQDFSDKCNLHIANIKDVDLGERVIFKPIEYEVVYHKDLLQGRIS